MPERGTYTQLVSMFGAHIRGADSAFRVLRLIVGALVIQEMDGLPPTNERLQQRMTARGWWSKASFYRDLKLFRDAFPGEKPADVAQRFLPYVTIDLQAESENLLQVMDVPWGKVRRAGSE